MLDQRPIKVYVHLWYTRLVLLHYIYYYYILYKQIRHVVVHVRDTAILRLWDA